MELMERRRIILDTPHISLQDGMQFDTDMVAPIESLAINFSPIQDLHGYDNPWPAGGGKNLFGLSDFTDTYHGVTYEYESLSGKLSINGTSTAGAGTNVGEITMPEGTYTFSADFTNASGFVQILLRDKATNTNVEEIRADRPQRTVTLNGTYYIRIAAQGGSVNSGYVNNIQLELGESKTDFAPYSNICPISGWTGANVSATGINIWDEEWEVGGISNGGNIPETDKIRSKNYIPVVSGNTYFFYCKTNDLIFLSYYDSDKNYLGYSSGIRNVAVTMPERCRYIRFRMQTTYGTTYNHDISINYPSTDHSYHPYTGRSITIDLGQTVYGGTLDIVSGELVVDRKIVTYNGTEVWTWNGAYGPNGLYRASISVSDINTSYSDAEVCPTLISNEFQTIKYNYGAIKAGITSRYKYAQINVFQSTATSSAEWTTFLSNNNLQVVYELATPQTYQLTPQQILALKGINNLSMSGQVKFWTHRDIQ